MKRPLRIHFTILPSLNRGSGSGVSGWINAFILDVFISDTETRDIWVNLLSELYNKMLAGQIQSPLWLLSRLVLISSRLIAPSLLSRLMRIHPPRQSLFALSVSRRSSTVSQAAPLFVLRYRWLAPPWHLFNLKWASRSAARSVLRVWCGQRVRWSATGVKQGDPAGPLDSTYPVGVLGRQPKR